MGLAKFGGDRGSDDNVDEADFDQYVDDDSDGGNLNGMMNAKRNLLQQKAKRSFYRYY